MRAMLAERVEDSATSQACDTKKEKDVANLVILKGRLGAKPEVRRVGAQNTPVVDVSVATNAFAKGEKSTDWHKVTLWDRQAELVGQLEKGSEVYVEGALKTEEWTDKEGNKRYKTYIRAFKFEYCGSRGDGAPRTGAVGPKTNPFGDDELMF